MKFVTTGFLFLAVALLATSCGHQTEDAAQQSATEQTDAPDLSQYPPELREVLDAHGGLARWQANRQLSYAMPRNGASETQLIDLHNRREYISQPAGEGITVEQGYDGENLWITADTTYKGNPRFYQNLMFYFYAMPWVLADPGIQYTTAEPLEYNGASYPGILISYDDGVGFSPKDNYRLHYDPATKKMRWLGYTVTARTGEASDNFKWIEYPTWTDYNGVELADSLVWYTVEDNLPVAPRNTRVFSDVKVSEAAADDQMFAPREGARMVE